MDTGNELAAFAALVTANPAATPAQRSAKRRADRGGRSQDVPESRREIAPKGNGGGGASTPLSDAGVVALPPPSEKDGASVMAYLESLAGKKDYFKLFEDAMKANISVLVPAYMSMESFTKSLQNLREGNMEAARESGTTSEDPLEAIRTFLSSEPPKTKTKGAA